MIPIRRGLLLLGFGVAMQANVSCADEAQGSESATGSASRDAHAGLGALYSFDFEGWSFCMERSNVSLFERFNSEHGYLDITVVLHDSGKPYVFEDMIGKYYENQLEEGRAMIIEIEPIEIGGIPALWFGSEYKIPRGDGNQVVIKRNYLCVLMAKEFEMIIDLSPSDLEPVQAKQFLQSFRFLKTSDIPPFPHIELTYEGACAQDASGSD